MKHNHIYLFSLRLGRYDITYRCAHSHRVFAFRSTDSSTRPPSCYPAPAFRLNTAELPKHTPDPLVSAAASFARVDEVALQLQRL